MKWNAFANDDDLAFEFTPNFNSNPGGFLVDPNAPRGRRQIRGRDRQRRAPATPPTSRGPAPAQWHHYALVIDTTAPAAEQIIPYVDGQPVAYEKTDIAAPGAGNFANSTLYFMSRGRQRPVRRRRPRRGRALQPGAAGRRRSPSTSAATARRRSPRSRPRRTRPQTGQQVSFNGSASSDPDGTIAKYEWDLDGNGTYETEHRAPTPPRPQPTPPRAPTTSSCGSPTTAAAPATTTRTSPSSSPGRVLREPRARDGRPDRLLAPGRASGTTLADSKGGVNAHTLGRADARAPPERCRPTPTPPSSFNGTTAAAPGQPQPLGHKQTHRSSSG